MAIRDAKDITAEEYEDGIFIIEDDEQMASGVWLIPDSWVLGNRQTPYARWYSDRATAERETQG